MTVTIKTDVARANHLIDEWADALHAHRQLFAVDPNSEETEDAEYRAYKAEMRLQEELSRIGVRVRRHAKRKMRAILRDRIRKLVTELLGFAKVLFIVYGTLLILVSVVFAICRALGAINGPWWLILPYTAICLILSVIRAAVVSSKAKRAGREPTASDFWWFR